MKTDEQWMCELAFARKHPEDCNAIVSRSIIREIQLDAQSHGEAIGWEKGMREAARIAQGVREDGKSAGYISLGANDVLNRILSAIDAKKGKVE